MCSQYRGISLHDVEEGKLDASQKAQEEKGTGAPPVPTFPMEQIIYCDDHKSIIATNHQSPSCMSAPIENYDSTYSYLRKLDGHGML
jgi:hypothetical protein